MMGSGELFVVYERLIVMVVVLLLRYIVVFWGWMENIGFYIIKSNNNGYINIVLNSLDIWGLYFFSWYEGGLVVIKRVWEGWL